MLYIVELSCSSDCPSHVKMFLTFYLKLGEDSVLSKGLIVVLSQEPPQPCFQTCFMKASLKSSKEGRLGTNLFSGMGVILTLTEL